MVSSLAFMVEAPGIEPGSEVRSPRVHPCALRLLVLASWDSGGWDSRKARLWRFNGAGRAFRHRDPAITSVTSPAAGLERVTARRQLSSESQVFVGSCENALFNEAGRLGTQL